MAITIIELDSPATVAFHAPLWNSPRNQIRRKVGRYSTVYVGDHCGTVKDADGKCWDWWMSDNGTVTIVEAK